MTTFVVAHVFSLTSSIVCRSGHTLSLVVGFLGWQRFWPSFSILKLCNMRIFYLHQTYIKHFIDITYLMWSTSIVHLEVVLTSPKVVNPFPSADSCTTQHYTTKEPPPATQWKQELLLKTNKEDRQFELFNSTGNFHTKCGCTGVFVSDGIMMQL